MAEIPTLLLLGCWLSVVWCRVPGAGCLRSLALAIRHRFEMLPQHLAPGTWHLAPGTWHLAPGSYRVGPSGLGSGKALAPGGRIVRRPPMNVNVPPI